MAEVMWVSSDWSSRSRIALQRRRYSLRSSILISLYYLYRMLTTPGNENKASNAVTILCLLAPSIMQRYLKDAVCAILLQLPFGFFQTCPLDSVGSEVTLMVSIGASFQAYILSQVNQFGSNIFEIHAKGLERMQYNMQTLTFDDVDAIKKLSTVKI